MLVLTVLLQSCGLDKKLVYFQSSKDTAEQKTRSYTPRFKPDDLLSIVVTSSDPLASQPFNLEVAPQTVQPPNTGYSTGSPARAGYLIDASGIINMPILGSIQILGLNRMEATELIQEKLTKYLKDPIVQIRILNFKVTVLGDVKAPGSFSIPNERITLLEAIGLAGDLTITGNRKNVKVIRNDGTLESHYTIDLTSQEVFNSPVYYLEQNDVVYVEPNKAARTQSTVWSKTGTFFVSISSVIVSTIAVLTK